MICIYIYIYLLEPSLPANVRSEASWFLEQAWLKNDQRQAVGYAVVTRRFQKKHRTTVEVVFVSRCLGKVCFLLVGNGTWEVTDSANQSVWKFPNKKIVKGLDTTKLFVGWKWFCRLVRHLSQRGQSLTFKLLFHGLKRPEKGKGWVFVCYFFYEFLIFCWSFFFCFQLGDVFEISKHDSWWFSH